MRFFHYDSHAELLMVNFTGSEEYIYMYMPGGVIRYKEDFRSYITVGSRCVEINLKKHLTRLWLLGMIKK